MEVNVNQEIIEFNGNTITDLLKDRNIHSNGGFVVAVNKAIVLKSRWNRFKLKDNDSVAIIIPAFGG